MAEVFQGTPVLVSVRIDGPDGRMVQYHVAGRDVSFVADAVKEALEGLPGQDKREPAPVKARKPRRTKAEIAADKKKAEASEDAKEDAANTGPQKESVWP